MSEADERVRELLGQLGQHSDDRLRGVLVVLRAAVRRWPGLAASERSALEKALECSRREGYEAGQAAGLALGRWEAGRDGSR